VRANPKLSGTTHNVFGIQTGVAISFLVKKRGSKGARIFYSRQPEMATAEEKLSFLSGARLRQMDMVEVVADKTTKQLFPPEAGMTQKLTDALPKGVRVDQNVDGVVELARTGDVLHVARPAIGEAHATVTVFKLSGGEARRVTVKFGRAAVKDIEIASGLAAGDQIVLSDMSRWDGHDRLRIE